MPKSRLSFCVSFHSAPHPRQFLLWASPRAHPRFWAFSLWLSCVSTTLQLHVDSLYVRFVTFSLRCTSRSLRVQFVVFSICAIVNSLHCIFAAWRVAFSFRCIFHSLHFRVCIVAGFAAFSIQCVSDSFYVRFVVISSRCISNLLYSPFFATQRIQNATNRKNNECNIQRITNTPTRKYNESKTKIESNRIDLVLGFRLWALGSGPRARKPQNATQTNEASMNHLISRTSDGQAWHPFQGWLCSRGVAFQGGENATTKNFSKHYISDSLHFRFYAFSIRRSAAALHFRSIIFSISLYVRIPRFSSNWCDETPLSQNGNPRDEIPLSPKIYLFQCMFFYVKN